MNKFGRKGQPRQAVTQPEDPSYRIIPLTKGQVALVDTMDFDRISRFKWCASWSPFTKSFYAIRKSPRPNGRQLTIRMHNEILPAPRGLLTDHKSHDTLDNRSSNLRVANRYQNRQNSSRSSRCGGEVKGVYKRTGTNKWRACITANGKRISIGDFPDMESAAAARMEVANKLFGEFAYHEGVKRQTEEGFAQ